MCLLDFGMVEKDRNKKDEERSFSRLQKYSADAEALKPSIDTIFKPLQIVTL
jgi:hypothetical protein